MKYLIYDSHSAFDRQIRASLSTKTDCISIDWYNDKKGREVYLKAYPNPSNFPCIVDAETKEKVIVSSDIATAEIELNKLIDLFKAGEADKYKFKRKYQYEKSGLTVENWMIAYVQKEIDNDDSSWEELIAKRKNIKTQFPKED